MGVKEKERDRQIGGVCPSYTTTGKFFIDI